VKTVEEIEQQCNGDQCDEYRKSERVSVHVMVPGLAMDVTRAWR
jgi:hypothetical protein